MKSMNRSNEHKVKAGSDKMEEIVSFAWYFINFSFSASFIDIKSIFVAFVAFSLILPACLTFIIDFVYIGPAKF